MKNIATLAPKKFILLFLTCSVLIFAFTSQAAAHPFQYSAIKTNLTVKKNLIDLHTEVSKQISYFDSSKADQKQGFENYFKQTFTISNGGEACIFRLDKLDNSKNTLSTFDGVFTCTSSIENISALKIESTLFDSYFQNYDHFVNIKFGTEQKEVIFRSSRPQQVQPSRLSLTAQFIRMGVVHIWTGYDHILFLLSLIIVMRSVKSILLVITAFTLAHSITLILAGFGIITLSPRIVEPLIALTIVFVAFRNLQILRSNKRTDTDHSGRWLLAAGFGLIHGLGFAGVLKEAGIPANYFVPSLVFFNLGVEIGQLSILALLVPILLVIKRYSWRKKVLIVTSVIILVLGVSWLLLRLWLLVLV